MENLDFVHVLLKMFALSNLYPRWVLVLIMSVWWLRKTSPGSERVT